MPTKRSDPLTPGLAAPECKTSVIVSHLGELRLDDFYTLVAVAKAYVCIKSVLAESAAAFLPASAESCGDRDSGHHADPKSGHRAIPYDRAGLMV